MLSDLEPISFLLASPPLYFAFVWFAYTVLFVSEKHNTVSFYIHFSVKLVTNFLILYVYDAVMEGEAWTIKYL